MKLIMTGTGRCGTKFHSRLLRSIGWEAKHELVFDPNVTLANVQQRMQRLGSVVDAEASWIVTAFLSHPALKNIKIVHLVREPLPCMASMLQVTNFYGMRDANPLNGPVEFWLRCLYRHLPEIEQMKGKPLKQAMIMYLAWNRIVEEQRPDAILHRIEDGPQAFCERIGISLPEQYFNDEKCNTRGPVPDLGWDDYPDCPLKEETRAYAQSLGYAV